MKITAQEIAALVQGQVRGDGTVTVDGAAGLAEATPTDVSFVRDAKNPKQLKALEMSKAGVVMVPAGVSTNGRTVVEVKNPIDAFSRILDLISKEKRGNPAGVHPLASIAKSAKIGADVNIGPFTVVEEGAEIGDNVWLLAQVYVGKNSKVGNGSIIYPQAVIREDVHIGQRCVIHGGAVIGSDGYGFYFQDGRHNKIPQIGMVIIGDDVEIGSCTTIDRAQTGKTIIGSGTKIDNLVQVAHNVHIGENCLLVAQVGIAGSSKLGRGVVIGGQAGVIDHVVVGDGVQIGGKAGVMNDVPAGVNMMGSPATPIVEALRQISLERRLPELYKEVKSIKDRLKHDQPKNS